MPLPSLVMTLGAIGGGRQIKGQVGRSSISCRPLYSAHNPHTDEAATSFLAIERLLPETLVDLTLQLGTRRVGHH